MENPATWTLVEHVIFNALAEAKKGAEEGYFGLSTTRQISDALRAAGLIAADVPTEKLGFEALQTEDIMTFKPASSGSVVNPPPMPFDKMNLEEG